MTDTSNNRNAESLKIAVSVDDLKRVLQLAECGSDDRAEYLFGPYAESDLGDELHEARAALESQQQSVAALRAIVALVDP